MEGERTSPVSASDTGPPDWAQVDAEVHCPLCEYNLRGLTEPRCPECGYQFSWSEVLDPSRRLHPYVFEHHPEANVSSFLKTTLAGFRPFRFWMSLHPAQPSHLRRLLVFALVGHLVFLLGLLAVFSAIAYVDLTNHQQDYAQWIVNASNRLAAMPPDQRQAVLTQYGSAEGYVRRWYGPPLGFFDVLKYLLGGSIGAACFRLSVIAGFCLLWPWVTFVALWGMWLPGSKARITLTHHLRCALYCFDYPLWGGAIVSVLLVAGSLLMPRWQMGRWVEGGIPSLILLVWSMCTLRLYPACKHYMRSRRPLVMALGSQFLALLIYILVIGAPFAIAEALRKL